MTGNFVNQPERTYDPVRFPKQLRGTIGGAPTTATPIRYAKLAQIVGDELRCFAIAPAVGDPSQVLSGDDMRTIAGTTSAQFAVGTTYLCDGQPPVPAPQVGDVLEILSGADAGNYPIMNMVDCRGFNVIIDSPLFIESTDFILPWRIEVVAGIAPGSWPVDYAQVFKPIGGPDSPLHRYRPYMGPGDHTGSDLVTTAVSTTVTSAGANFLDAANPVVPGMYIEITGGPDAGRHLIAGVTNGTTLELVTALTAASTGLSYRIDIVSAHATTLQLVPVSGGQLIAVPDAGSVEVKIARPIRDEIDAAAFDTIRELGTTEALDLFNELGAYLACYRLQTTASHSQGVPVDDRVIIAAKPWRGHLVSGVLYFDDQNPAQPKYDLSDADEPVWPIRWLRDHWRVEDTIAEAEKQEPAADNVCP